MKRIEGNIVDIRKHRIYPGIISIQKGKIVSIVENDAHYSHYIAPGFIDSHVHVESSMLTPFRFSELAIQRGTVAVINDPHEIANVLGYEGILFMIENSKSSIIKNFFTIPSCVPSTAYDYSGSIITSQEVKQLLDTGYFIGLSEVMNVPGVIHQDEEVIKKINYTREKNLVIDGHAPGLSGKDLKKYIGKGITTDHECTNLEEAIEKIQAGMKILIREGSAAKNYEALKTLIKEYPEQLMFCTDDSHPGDLISSGQIDKIVKRAVKDGFDLFDVLKIACINPVLHYKIPVGTLQPGEPADFVIFEKLKDFQVRSVFIDGEENFNNESFLFKKDKIDSYPLNKFIRTPISLSELENSVEKEIFCIQVYDGEIITGKTIYPVEKCSNFESDLERDILKIVYLNRYTISAPQISYIHGIGLKAGAFATSISHDSHNIIAVGTNDVDLLQAINAVINQKGGLSISLNPEIYLLSLPIGGIMTDKDGAEVAGIWNEFLIRLRAMGCQLTSPFMTLSFMALIVIPELKIGEKGLFEYSTFRFIKNNCS